ncbi:hypothetical protein [Clostridium cuniculi]|uniref:hypothetical protein n=1 Tax=Clostridium cuniculi TaxID=2548455 RepID=UPI001055F940|nr:hypothetical protein [Clostridium cuniculi]
MIKEISNLLTKRLAEENIKLGKKRIKEVSELIKISLTLEDSTMYGRTIEEGVEDYINFRKRN